MNPIVGWKSYGGAARLPTGEWRWLSVYRLATSVAETGAAVCLQRGHHTQAPVRSCSCGYYALGDPPDLSHFLFFRRPTLLCRVELWGKVVEHEHGYRAQYQRVTDVWPVLPAVLPLLLPPSVEWRCGYVMSESLPLERTIVPSWGPSEASEWWQTIALGWEPSGPKWRQDLSPDAEGYVFPAPTSGLIAERLCQHPTPWSVEVLPVPRDFPAVLHHAIQINPLVGILPPIAKGEY